MKQVIGSVLLLFCVSCAKVPMGANNSVKPPDSDTDTAIATTQPTSFPEPPTVAKCNIAPAIEWMASQNIIYTQNPSSEWRDCSGNFLRLSSRIASICDVDMVAPPGITEYIDGAANNERPGIERARTTRGIAEWYDRKGMFEPIYYDGMGISDAPESLHAVRNRIKPGSVLWFSRKPPLAANGKLGLYKEAGGVINHMGTVTSVVRNADGQVIEWKMYHGQNERKHNGITHHWWDWPAKYTSRGQQYPPGGYWDQRIVGFAESLVPDDEEVDVVALYD